jgi:hypothetical protein
MGRKIFRSIAHEIHRYHHFCNYCGDIYGLIRISMLGFDVLFPFGLHPALDCNCFFDDSFYDIVHFCY